MAGLVVKLQNCQLSYDMASLAIDVMGELGVLYDHTKYERERGYWQAQSIFSLGLIIGGGTAQIQKNIIAERGLGLPREPEAGDGLREARKRHGLRTLGRSAAARRRRCAASSRSRCRSSACASCATRTARTTGRSGARWPSSASTGILVPEAQGGSGLAPARRGAGLAGARPRRDTDALPQLGGHGADRAALARWPASEAWLAGIAAGELVFGVARDGALLGARRGRCHGSRVAHCSGKAMMALDARAADLLLVAIDGDTLAWSAATRPGLEITRLTTVDATRCTAEVRPRGRHARSRIRRRGTGHCPHARCGSHRAGGRRRRRL